MKRNVCSKAIIATISTLATISPIFIATGNTIKSTNTFSQSKAVETTDVEYNLNSRASDYTVQLPNDQYANYDYHNAFANAYDKNFALGLNNKIMNYTNGWIGTSGNSIAISSFAGNDSSRNISQVTNVPSDPYSTFSSMISTQNGLSVIKTPVDSADYIWEAGLQSMCTYSEANVWDNIVWRTKTDNGVKAARNNKGGTILSTTIDNDCAISCSLQVTGGSYSPVSTLRFDTNNQYTDTDPEITSATGMTQSSQSNYIGGAYTYVKTGFDHDGVQTVDVFSGNTTYSGDTIQFKPIDVSPTDKEKYSASQWLKDNVTQLYKRVSINLTNGFPGSLKDAVTFSANDDSGTISIIYSPKTRLSNGVVAAENRTITKTIIDGFGPGSTILTGFSTPEWGGNAEIDSIDNTWIQRNILNNINDFITNVPPSFAINDIAIGPITKNYREGKISFTLTLNGVYPKGTSLKLDSFTITGFQKQNKDTTGPGAIVINNQGSSDSSDLWMWVGIGIGSAVVVAGVITGVIIYLKKKGNTKTAKVNSITKGPANNNKLGFSGPSGQKPGPSKPGASAPSKPGGVPKGPAPRPGTGPAARPGSGPAARPGSGPAARPGMQRPSNQPPRVSISQPRRP